MFTLTVEMSVFTDDKATAISEAQRLLPDLLDGTDFVNINVIDAKLDLVHAECPRCIEDYQDDDGKDQKGESVQADCDECGVCVDCEHLCECSKAN